jgi:carbamoyltransferase
MSIILGLTSYFHDSSVCLLVDGEVKSYVEEERFNRVKHTHDYAKQSVDWALKDAGATLDDVDAVVFYLNPAAYLRTGIRMALANFPWSLQLAKPGSATTSPMYRLWRLAGLKRWLVSQHGGKGKFDMVFLDHYRTHQASAFYPSGFDDAAVLTMDFAVDGTTEVIAHGQGGAIIDKVNHRIPHGFAIIYAALTHVLGFKWNDEYKVMGMAAYGEPRFLSQVEKLYELDAQTGALRLDLSYFNFQNTGRKTLFSPKMADLFGPPRDPRTELTQREYDIAASMQAAVNRYGITLARLARDLTGSKNLCMAGGVAQNCLMNQAICEARIFDNVFLQPLAGDVGGSLGGALYHYHATLKQPRKYRMQHLYLGPSFSETIPRAVARAGLMERPVTASGAGTWHKDVAQAIADGKVVGFFQGRMEAGPRALGGRSIIADARRGDMKDILNQRVKHREHFRPFAPSVLADKIDMVFEPLPACRSLEYMIVTMNVRPEWRDKVPTITHGDGTARVQAINPEHAPDYYKVVEEFFGLTGVPLVVNTSFNDNEPIVCTPDDAINCFLRTNIDLLVLDGRLFFREDNGHVCRDPVLLVSAA